MFMFAVFKRGLLRFWQRVTPGGYRPERRYMRGANSPAAR
jgi:hypothetical protein